jgi:mRNA-degrading endonuclease HigB of HigAB toxin-antitoxin module
MAQNNSPKFIDYIDDLVDIYNETPHSALDNKTPAEVYADGELQKKIYKKAHKHNNELKGKIGLNIGDFVRRANVKNKFEKEKQTFSRDIFVVYDIEGARYRLIDEDGDVDTTRLYKYHELLKVDAEKTKTPSIVIILNKHFGKSKKGKRKAYKDMDEVEKATNEYRRVKKVAKH